MSVRTFRHPDGMVQRLAVSDLCVEGVDVFRSFGDIHVVYSDPPWNPGNEKWWRTYANLDPPKSYGLFLDSWCRCACLGNPEHIFCEQSVNSKHRDLLKEAVLRCDSWVLPLIEEWTIWYGSPSRPNVLMHFGRSSLGADLTDMRGEEMVALVLDTLNLPKGSVVADPCMGLGTTSRQAHKHGLCCVGTELNPVRLDRTIGWLLRSGYSE